jgi:TatD DNase family protein
MLIDTHCHLDFADFDAERDELIARAHASGVRQMVTISTRVRKAR